MKLNEDKCHFLILGHKYESVWAKIGETKIWKEDNAKLLGINIDSKLSFNKLVSPLCVKAWRKLTALTRLVEKRRLLMKLSLRLLAH